MLLTSACSRRANPAFELLLCARDWAKGTSRLGQGHLLVSDAPDQRAITPRDSGFRAAFCAVEIGPMTPLRFRTPALELLFVRSRLNQGHLLVYDTFPVQMLLTSACSRRADPAFELLLCARDSAEGTSRLGQGHLLVSDAVRSRLGLPARVHAARIRLLSCFYALEIRDWATP